MKMETLEIMYESVFLTDIWSDPLNAVIQKSNLISWHFSSFSDFSLWNWY